MTTTSDARSTLYPKITSHISEVIHTLLTVHCDPVNPDATVTLAPVPITGTVKLHGTHADVLIYDDNSIVFQSRNTVGLSAEKDNQGFAAALAQKTAVLLELRDVCLARWRHLNPSASLDQSAPVVLAGEWIGTKIQKDVAISQLSRRFVIVSISINAQWQRDEDFADIEDAGHDIYNVRRAGVYRGMLFSDDIQRTVEETQQMAEQVAIKCPFAELFGVEGEGEGIVWKLSTPSSSNGLAYHANPALWSKTKGGRFKPPIYQPPQLQNTEAAEHARIEVETAASTWCNTQRLEQGWDVLRERGIKRDAQGLGAFLTWVQQDILTEEKKSVEDAGIQAGVLRKEIAKIARPWYRARMREGAE